MSRAQRDYFLREQLKAIRAELGEGEEAGGGDPLRRRLEALQLPEEARREVDRELERLSDIPEASPEYGQIRSWLELIASLPWNTLTGAAIDIPRARRVLDEDHYDLEKVKDRILEHLAVRKLRLERRAWAEAAETGEAPAVNEIAGTGLAPAVNEIAGTGLAPPVNEIAGTGLAPPVNEIAGTGQTADTAAVPPVNEIAETGGDPDATLEPVGETAMREPILCFVGPPGEGKTSLGQSIARALGRKFVRIALGGVRDEAEIRGHRRTYIGAMPGRIVQGIKRAEALDPVFMLDEIDKLGADWRGDPSSALLEVLDPVQNHSFTDTYLGVAFDLSQVLFIATANTLDSIPAPLLDRMEILPLSGYSEQEKLHIAERYLVPRERAAHGLRHDEVQIDPEAILAVIRGYTREAGVRDLDRQIATLCRKIARDVAEGKTEPVRITADLVGVYLGRPRFFQDAAERTDRPGVATGLAWTPTGGDVLFIEAALLTDHQTGLLLTGMLGDVMRESAQAALSYVRAEAERLGIDPAAFSSRTLHVHVPAGAVPKDGPSAGVAILAAIVSIARRQPIRGDVAMTGEITLRGRVLPVGGIKEKVLAAHRAGIKTVILPRHNERDLEDVTGEVRGALEFVLADTADDVLAHAFAPSLDFSR
jgi:ATP-dependent Lon protease